MSHTGDDWQIDTQFVSIENYLNFFSISIAGKEPQEPNFGWKEITGFDEEASKKAARETIERLKNELN